MRPLTAKQEAFVEYYCNPGSESYNNGLKSARKAGYEGSDDILKAIACQNLAKPHIKQKVLKYKVKTIKKMDVTESEIITELRAIAGLEGAASATGDVKLTVNNRDRLRALELLGKYKAMWTDVVKDVTDQQRTLSDSEKEQARILAAEINRQNLKAV